MVAHILTKAVDKRLHCAQNYSGVVSLSVFGGNFVLAKVRLGAHQCPLFGVERCPLLGGSKCISFMVKSIGVSDLSAVQRLSAFRRVRY